MNIVRFNSARSYPTKRAHLMLGSIICLLLGGCVGVPFTVQDAGGGSGGGGTTAFVTASAPDPIGDATSPAPGSTPWDITLVNSSRLSTGATTLTVSVTLTQAISTANLPAAGSKLTSPSQLGITVLINTGAAGGTVTPTAGACTGNPSYPNVTFFIDPGMSTPRLADGNFAILNAANAPVGEASVILTGNTLSYSIPISAIGGAGAVRIAAIAGNGAGATDCAPDSSFLLT